jgi:hypothetical protein
LCVATVLYLLLYLTTAGLATARKMNADASVSYIWQMNFLYTKVAAAAASQSSVEDSLKHIEEQQNALNRTLDSYEQQTKAILNTQGRQLDLGPANRERDNRCVVTSSGHRKFYVLGLYEPRLPAVPPR